MTHFVRNIFWKFSHNNNFYDAYDQDRLLFFIYLTLFILNYYFIFMYIFTF